MTHEEDDDIRVLRRRLAAWLLGKRIPREVKELSILLTRDDSPVVELLRKGEP